MTARPPWPLRWRMSICGAGLGKGALAPIAGEALKSAALIPNLPLRKLCADFARRQPALAG